MKNNEVQLRRWFLFAVAAVGILLGILTFTFVNEVRDQLWEQSVGTIIESTRQGGKCSEHSAQGRFFFYCFHKKISGKASG